jgi:dihydropteroate synthase
VMGILNITPDSFSDGGNLYSGSSVDLSKTLYAVEQMLTAGADIIDVGGESTRPGAAEVSEQQELDRVLPVVQGIASRFDALISVDTSTAEVIKQAAGLGAHMINDVRALQREGALAAAVASGLPVCLMHMQNQPKSMQDNPTYGDVVADVLEFLQQRKQICLDAGIASDQIVLDPGFGFGKTLEHNLALFAALDRFSDDGSAVLVGVSRKTMIGQLIDSTLDSTVDKRLVGSVTMALLAAQSLVSAGGSIILRVHDVLETVQALTVWQQVKQFQDREKQ